MDFELPADLVDFLAKIDDFIETEIKPLEQEDDNIRFLDHRREDARTDWDRGGLPNAEWEDLMREARKRADKAGIYRYSYPKRLGGMDGTNLGMAVIREHLAAKGLGPALRPADRAHHRRQHPRRDADGAVRQRRAEGLLAAADDRARRRLRLRHHRAQPRLRRHLDGDQRLPRRRRVGHQRQQDVEHGPAQRHPRRDLRPHQRRARRGHRDHRLHRADRHAGLRDRRVPVDVQHADRPRHDQADERAGERLDDLRRRGPRPPGRAELRQREPHPPGRIVARRRPVLHQRVDQVRPRAQAVRQAAGRQPGASSSRSSSCRRSATCCAC